MAIDFVSILNGNAKTKRKGSIDFVKILGDRKPIPKKEEPKYDQVQSAKDMYAGKPFQVFGTQMQYPEPQRMSVANPFEAKNLPTTTPTVAKPQFNIDQTTRTTTPMRTDTTQNLPGELARLLPRAATSVGLDVLNKNEYKPKNKVAKFLLGEEPIKSAQKETEETYGSTLSKLTKYGVNKDVATGMSLAIAPLIVGGSKSLDLLLPGGSEKNAIKALTKVTDTIEASKLMRSFGLSEDIIKDFAPTFAKTKTVVETEQAWKSMAKVLKPTVTDTTKTFQVDKYIAEQVAKQEAARKAAGTNLFTKLIKEAKSKLVDSSAPIEDTLRTSLKENKITLKPSEDINSAIGKVLRSPGMAEQFVKDNGLDLVIQKAPNLKYLDQYLIAKQARDVEALGIKTGRDLAKDKAMTDALADEYEAFAQQVNDYSRKLLDYSVDSGLISRETGVYLKAKYPNYVPINRIFNELEKGVEFTGKGGIASLSKQTVLQKLKGSDKPIENPLESLVDKTVTAFREGEKNKAAKLLASYKDLPNNPFQLYKLEKGQSAANTISYLEDGKKVTYETTPDIARAAKSMGVQQMNILGKIFATPVRIAKLGITGINVPFALANLAKDQVTAFINSRYALRGSIANPVNFLRALFDAVGHGAFYQEMIRAGGGGTSFDIARNAAKTSVEKLRSGKSVGSKVAFTVRHPSELLRAVENTIARTEELTRLQQARVVKKQLLKEGMSEADATAGAARAYRESTVDFSRRGEWGTVLNSAFLYLNANIQGTRTFVRNFKTKPIQTTAKIATVVFTPIAMATFWNLSDPKRKEAYQDIAEFEKENNLVILPPNPVKGENGKWNAIKIPLSQEINNIANIPRRFIEQSFDLNEVKATEIAHSLLGAVSPITPDKGSVFSTLTPQAVKPAIEGIANYNLFTGQKQVPESMTVLPPELQYKKTTSGTARQIGENFKIPPLKVDAFITGTFGGLGQQLVHASDLALNKMDIIPADQIGGKNVVDAVIGRFYETVGGAISDKSNEELKKIISNQAGEKFKLTQEAEILYADLSKMPKDEANAKAEELKATNPKLYNSLATVVENERKGLTYNDRLILQLNVTNGERAKFIWSTLKDMQTREEKNAYVEQLRNKGIISENVMKQLYELKSKNY